jgi:tetratricopeptide (TPR) repeat protein
MSKPKRSDNVIRFPVEAVAKLGFERVKKPKRSKKNRMETLGQLDLFSEPTAEVLRLPTDFGAFEQALRLDESGSESAAEVYRQAISNEDHVADAYCNLGIMESRSGNVSAAFDCFTRSLEHDPRHFESHYNLGNLYFEMDDRRLAHLHYGLAVEVEPGFPNVYFNLGLVHALNQDFPAAIDALTTYKDLAPEGEGDKADELLDSLRTVTN